MTANKIRNQLGMSIDARINTRSVLRVRFWNETSTAEINWARKYSLWLAQDIRICAECGKLFRPDNIWTDEQPVCTLICKLVDPEVY